MTPDRLRLWPAIDLRLGRVVRLLKGELGTETVYDTPPLEVAKRFESEGADGIHVVDLDAAFGLGENRASIEAILHGVGVSVQVGGGIRTAEDAERILGAGALRVVLGSLPFTNPKLFRTLLGHFARAIVVALDCKDGHPAIRGWKEDSGAGDAAAVATWLKAEGADSLLVTDVARDGAMTGPNLELLSRVRKVFPGEILASGGMRGAEDVAPVDGALAGGARGAIFGRSLHDGRTSIAALRAARDGGPR